jgi:hypothetical protein
MAVALTSCSLQKAIQQYILCHAARASYLGGRQGAELSMFLFCKTVHSAVAEGLVAITVTRTKNDKRANLLYQPRCMYIQQSLNHSPDEFDK